MLAKMVAMAERKFPINYGQKLKLAARVASLTAAGAANAGTVVATIDGCYDRLSYDTRAIFPPNGALTPRVAARSFSGG